MDMLMTSTQITWSVVGRLASVVGRQRESERATLSVGADDRRPTTMKLMASQTKASHSMKLSPPAARSQP